MKAARLIVVVTVILGTLVSCERPANEETFVKASDKDGQGRYGFVLNMDDSTCVYDLSIFTKVDCTQEQLDMMPDINMVMSFVSPSLVHYGEEFCVEKSEYSRHERFSVDYSLPYRVGLVPVEYGLWQLYVTVPQEDKIEGFRGVGLRVSRRSK